MAKKFTVYPKTTQVRNPVTADEDIDDLNLDDDKIDDAIRDARASGYTQYESVDDIRREFGV